MEDLAVRPVPGKGRGVFAERDFAEGDLIERCPVLVIPDQQYPQYRATMLHDYGFRWRQMYAGTAIPLGYGCIYNHAPEPNVRFVRNLDQRAIDFVCVRPISAGDEITHFYGWRRARVPEWYEGSTGATPPPFEMSETVAVGIVIGGAAAVAGSLIAVARAARRVTCRRR